jgi:hypothetical protein
MLLQRRCRQATSCVINGSRHFLFNLLQAAEQVAHLDVSRRSFFRIVVENDVNNDIIPNKPNLAKIAHL